MCLQITIANPFGAVPNPEFDSGTIDPATGEVKAGGGSMYIPVETNNYTLMAISYYAPLDLRSDVFSKSILINVGMS